jgi:hypothetical protein
VLAEGLATSSGICLPNQMTEIIKLPNQLSIIMKEIVNNNYSSILLLIDSWVPLFQRGESRYCDFWNRNIDSRPPFSRLSGCETSVPI